MAVHTTNVPVLAKKISNVVSVLVFMLRKRKLMLDLNLLMKRSKNSNTTVFKRKKCHLHKGSSRFFSCAHAPPTMDGDYYDDGVVKSYAVEKVFDMLNNEAPPSSAVYCFLQSPMVRDMIRGEVSSPVLAGFGRKPVVRQLRVTDSPFPVVVDAEVDSHVDMAAEEFITKFYDNLRKQNKLAPP